MGRPVRPAAGRRAAAEPGAGCDVHPGAGRPGRGDDVGDERRHHRPGRRDGGRRAGGGAGVPEGRGRYRDDPECADHHDGRLRPLGGARAAAGRLRGSARRHAAAVRGPGAGGRHRGDRVLGAARPVDGHHGAGVDGVCRNHEQGRCRQRGRRGPEYHPGVAAVRPGRAGPGGAGDGDGAARSHRGAGEPPVLSTQPARHL